MDSTEYDEQDLFVVDFARDIPNIRPDKVKI
jgi:hypothetical protein